MTATELTTTRVAGAISDVVGPAPVFIALCLAGIHDGRPVLSSIGWAGLAIALLAVIPYAVTLRLRHPADGSRPSPQRKGGYMALVAGVSLLGLLVLALLPSPAALVDVAATVVLTLAAVAVATAAAGWSNHTAACAGGAAMCVVLDGPVWLLLVLAVVCVAWARVSLHRHSVSQAVFGAVWGGVVAAVILALLL